MKCKGDFTTRLSNSVLHVEYELAATMRAPLIELLDDLAEWHKLWEAEEPSTVPDRNLDSRLPRCGIDEICAEQYDESRLHRNAL